MFLFFFINSSYRQTKLHYDGHPTPINVFEDVIPYPEAHYIDQLHEFARTNRIPKMTTKIEKKIIEFVPLRLRMKYPRQYSQLLVDVHNEFDHVVSEFSLYRILKPSTTADCLRKFAFRQNGRTATYGEFLQNRQKLTDNLLIVQSFVKFILHSSQHDFPIALFDLSAYRQTSKVNNLSKLEVYVNKELAERALFLRSKWYPKVIAVLLKQYKRRKIPKKKWRGALDCVEGFINRQLIELKLRTFELMWRTMQMPNKVPFVEFTVAVAHDKCFLNPSFEQIFQTYSNIIDRTLDVGGDFICLEVQIDSQAFPARGTYLNVRISDAVRQEMLQKLNCVLRRIYAPILEYIKQFEHKLQSIYSHEQQTSLEDFLCGARMNEEYIENIHEHRCRLSEVHGIVANEYFDNATIHQTKAIKSIEMNLLKCIDQLTNAIVKNHRADCAQLAEWLDLFEHRALERPTSTEMLLANGDYMVHVKKAELEVVGHDVQRIMEVILEWLHTSQLPFGIQNDFHLCLYCV